MNQRSLNIIPGSPLAQARLCQVKGRRQSVKNNRPIYTLRAPLTAVYTTAKNHRCLHIPIFGEKCACATCTEGRKVTWPKTGIIHWSVFRERVFTLKNRWHFCRRLKRNSLQVLTFSISDFVVFAGNCFTTSVKLLCNFRRNTGMWDKFTIFACSVNAAHMYKLMGDLLRTTRKLCKDTF